MLQMGNCKVLNIVTQNERCYMYNEVMKEIEENLFIKSIGYP
jgi:hypothetical protein